MFFTYARRLFLLARWHGSPFTGSSSERGKPWLERTTTESGARRAPDSAPSQVPTSPLKAFAYIGDE